MELLTPNELSRILKLHPFTVTRLAREGKLPAFSAEGGSANHCGGTVGGVCLPARLCGGVVVLSEKQKSRKVNNLLQRLRREGKVSTQGRTLGAVWRLTTIDSD